MSAEYSKQYIIDFLKAHNEWRRFNGDPQDSPEMTNAIELGRVIDAAVKLLDDN